VVRNANACSWGPHVTAGKMAVSQIAWPSTLLRIWNAIAFVGTAATAQSVPRSGGAIRCVCYIIPEALELGMIQSVAGGLRGGGLSRERPFRDPHHSASLAALVGGRRRAEISPGRDLAGASGGAVSRQQAYYTPRMACLRRRRNAPIQSPLALGCRLGLMLRGFPPRKAGDLSSHQAAIDRNHCTGHIIG
jgi:hypothetical protein